MTDTNLNLNQYETEALKISLEKYIPILTEQIQSLKKMKYSSSNDKKTMLRDISKKLDLLNDILKKLN
ncbi:hypothetical protein HOD20_07590 [archaeon]|jgi:hypothetical protein|nr:hypothetical protein [archaeon]MBT4646976.1 hypothetical protein [archaeon]MBT6822571.1 hypothetical protein [archaeon]MBT7392756.1 hypothetical protein [archaeon]